MSEREIDKQKAVLRAQAFAQRAGLPDDQRLAAAGRAAELFLESIQVNHDQIIAGFWPIRDEIDVKPLLSRLMDKGHLVCLPVTMGSDQPLVFRQWKRGQNLVDGGFGTQAPGADAQVVQPDIIVLPLSGFDKTGTRLGYGKGHYDRTIAIMDKKPMLVGYAFTAQELPSIPRGQYDVPLDYMITEAGVTQF